MRNCDYANRSSQLITSDSARQILQRCSTKFTPTREEKTESLIQKITWDFFLVKCSGKRKKSPAIDLDQHRVLPGRILDELTARSKEGDLDRNNFLGKSYRAEYLRLQRSRENWSSANWTSAFARNYHRCIDHLHQKKAHHHGYIFVAAFYFKFQGHEDSQCNSPPLNADQYCFLGSL